MLVVGPKRHALQVDYAKWTALLMHVLLLHLSRLSGAFMGHAQMRYRRYRVLRIAAKCAAAKAHPDDV